MWKNFLGGIALLTCGVGCSLDAAATMPELNLEEESGQPLDAVPSVPRFRLEGLVGVAIEEIWLVEGEISSVSVGRMREGDVPQTVADSRLPLAVWSEGDQLVLAPSVRLEDAGRYSLVAFGVGLLGVFDVQDESEHEFHLWGPPDARSGDLVVYCLGKPPLSVVPLRDGLDADELSTLELPGAPAGAFCRQLTVPEGRDFFVPYTDQPGVSFEPTPVAVISRAMEFDETGPRPIGASLKLDGPALEVEVEPGTYRVEVTSQETIVALIDASESTKLLLGPFEPNSSLTAVVTRFFDRRTGDRSILTEEKEFTTGPAEPRFVLTEVLADPLGEEPQAEWIEILNAGTAPGSTSGLAIWDSGGGTELPDVTLGPGEYGVIVRQDFQLGPDPTPHAESVPLVVEQIGTSGLRNSGETVQLKTTQGVVLSEIPALSSSSGMSISRLGPWLPDVAASFASEHPSPGGPSAAAQGSTSREGH